MSDVQAGAEAATVRKLVVYVGDCMGDPEAAHAAEDHLWVRTLALIADGAQQPAELATLALLSRNFDFPRWYA